MTPKQVLVAHVEERHGGFPSYERGRARLYGAPARSWTREKLARWHARQHHRYSTNHRHAGSNTCAEDRPPGWWTGEDVEEWK